MGLEKWGCRYKKGKTLISYTKKFELHQRVSKAVLWTVL